MLAALAMPLALTAPAAMAQQQASTPPDAQRGSTIAAQGTQGGAAPCAQCHGAQGGGDPDGPFPRLAGQPAAYLWKQLQDYASGTRPNDIMTPIAQALTEQERLDTSAYFAGLKASAAKPAGDKDEQATASGKDPGAAEGGAKPQPQGKTAASGDRDGDIAAGRMLAIIGRTAIGDGARGVQACGNCHGPGGRGEPPLYPALAGQWQGYTAAQLQAFKAGQRHNDQAAVMREIAGKLSDEDMRAVSAYFQSLPPEAAPGNAPDKAQPASE